MAQLRRSMGFSQTFLYGLGTIVGAGIYALIGKIAGQAGEFAPLSLILAFLIALPTAYSYGQMAKLAPKCAGEAEYVMRGFNRRVLMLATGWAVTFTGIISCATLIKGFAGYLQVFIFLPQALVESLFAAALTLLAIKGIRESMWVSVSITLIEVAGILLVSYQSLRSSMSTQNIAHMQLENLGAAMPGVIAASFLAFYAFIGFEDMVNLAEEIKRPEKILPRSIFAALLIATLLYLLVLFASLRVLALEDLKTSASPMADVYAAAGGNPKVLGAIGLFAIINGALAQILMGSRVLYGLQHQKWPLSNLNALNVKTQTPARATILVGVLTLGFALLLPIESLATWTSYVILMVFTMVNLSFILIIENEAKPFAMLIAALGAFTNIALIASHINL